jgi:hypothetical protein
MEQAAWEACFDTQKAMSNSTPKEPIRRERLGPSLNYLANSINDR